MDARQRRRRLLSLAALSVALAGAKAQDRAGLLAPPTGRRELLVVGTHFDRVYERESDGSFSGIGAELLRQAAAQLGYPLRFESYPWKRAQVMLSQGLADILVGPYKSAERLQTMAFSERPIFQDEVAFYARAGSRQRWDGDYDALRSQRIVALNGWVYGDGFDRARPILHLSIANTVQNGLTMLVHGRVDLFASDVRDTDPVILELGLKEKVERLAPLIDLLPAYYAYPRRPVHDALRLEFDRVYRDMAARGELQKLGKRFGVSVP
ncbi:transporter substrate-binding domain-containing protein [Oxalobacteraceae bacterium]|nr:transporter substrate-binding domain-containing protein [Oxalobacteraceae bacterium]